MKLFVGIGCLAAVVLLSSAAVAFQDQNGGGTAAAQVHAGGTSEGPAAGLSDGMSEKRAGSPAGTVVRIPGLGDLGVLPKMDFGLELLYGATDSKSGELRREENTPPDDLTIKGRIKHNF